MAGSTYFNFRDLYGDRAGTSTNENTAPEPTEQDAIANVEQTAPSPRANHGNMLMWIGVLVVFIVLFHFGNR